ISILLNAFAETLVRKIEKRYEPPFLAQRDYFIPLLMRGVCSGRVVAARVQKNQALGGQSAKISEHGTEIETVRLRRVVRVLLNLETGSFKQRAMILPAGFADVHNRLG